MSESIQIRNFGPIMSADLQDIKKCENGTKHVALSEEAGEITIPGFSFNVVFQLSHILNYLLHEGGGYASGTNG